VKIADIIDFYYIIDMIEDKLVLRVSWRMVKSRSNCYELSAIFMNNPGEKLDVRRWT